MKRGFTVVELLITMTIMAILLGLGVVSMRSILVSGRDNERASDIQVMARGLEQRYSAGNPVITATTDPTDAQKGSYPSVHEMLHIIGWDQSSFYTPGQVSGGYETTAMPGTSVASFANPQRERALYVICLNNCAAAEDTAQINEPFTIGIKDWYVYEPIDSNGNICYVGNCPRYNLYYMREADNVVVKTKSKHQ